MLTLACFVFALLAVVRLRLCFVGLDGAPLLNNSPTNISPVHEYTDFFTDNNNFAYVNPKYNTFYKCSFLYTPAVPVMADLVEAYASLSSSSPDSSESVADSMSLIGDPA